MLLSVDSPTIKSLLLLPILAITQPSPEKPLVEVIATFQSPLEVFS
ncbi:hypothetical protein BAZSYMB_SCAFFOLD00028_18 [Bathymodiolus azoricus thioautotrophic gill symbiont]|uniref:Uncharacterized protein n=1 Tax=Bathymodiolus azoricus thioautotrophic gill symbiont TaxID=235205 RepID=A0A1H6JIA0_9GAMM|nr:hypothetical protein BAZSYMA_ACONTIG00454_4 [Bathymodiolus azoricus thioautotrophic gill symbiont]SEH76648.1 hypothetical protein BAZSYMB_SCAFFOLD00028_18 [Bathymodiolus azoricus thioautotrophic gill symbiont]